MQSGLEQAATQLFVLRAADGFLCLFAGLPEHGGQQDPHVRLVGLELLIASRLYSSATPDRR